MRKITKAGIGALGALALLAGVTSGPARADAGATATDFVLVGSDTVQNAANFLFDGDQHAHNGFNFSNKSTRVFSFDANGDDNGRAVYPKNSASALPVTEILRVGTLPVPRPNGSGAGIGALISDTVGNPGGYAVSGYPALPNGSINLVRASRLPKASENAACAALANCGGLHVYQFAYDNLQAATAITTNAPAGLSGVQLAHIFQCDAGYTHWNDAAIGGTSPNTIIPVIPQAGSGTQAFFLADMGAALGLSGSITPGACVQVGQEHDPSSIYGNPTPADVIMPFSTAKISLINSGYFGSYPQNKVTTNYNGAAGAYNTSRGLYFVARDYDIAHAGKYTTSQTSGNLYTYLFGGSSPWIARASQQTLIQSAGFSTAVDPIQGASFQDLGNLTAG